MRTKGRMADRMLNRTHNIILSVNPKCVCENASYFEFYDLNSVKARSCILMTHKE